MNNIAAEFNLLAGLSQNPSLYFSIQQYLSVDDFYDKTHKDYFIVLQRLLLKSDTNLIVNKPLLLAEATTIGFKNFYETCRNGEFIDACQEHKCNDKDTLNAFAQVKRETIKRSYNSFLKQKSKYLNDTTDSTSDIINTIDNGLLELSNKLQGSIDDEIINLTNKTEKIIQDLAHSPGEIGLNINMPIWQKVIGGLRNGSITFIAATSKCGKSQLGMRAAIDASQDIPVLYCDSELNETAQSVRAFGMFTGINYEILETGYWKLDYKDILSKGYDKTFATQCQIAKTMIEDNATWEKFKNKKLWYKKITGMTAREALPFLKRWVMQNVNLKKDNYTPRCLIVWDYIKLSRIDEIIKTGAGAHDVIGDTCMALHDFVEEFNIPMLAFGQTNRQINISIDMIAGAKKIVELVDSVSLIRKKDTDDLVKDPVGTHNIHILATRYGRGLDVPINIKADLSIGKFEELGISQPQILSLSSEENKNDNNAS